MKKVASLYTPKECMGSLKFIFFFPPNKDRLIVVCVWAGRVGERMVIPEYHAPKWPARIAIQILQGIQQSPSVAILSILYISD